MKKADIETFLKLQPKLDITHTELSVLSKKNPNDAVNKFKLKFVNDMLVDANKVLGEAYKPFGDFEQFSEDDLPTTSDVVFILSPYLRSLEKLRCDNIEREHLGSWYWVVDGEIDKSLRTDPPTIR